MDPEEIENRILELKRYNILDSDFEEDFDNITWLASKVCDMPIALISLLDESRQWFKSKVGLEVRETPIEYAFCKHACSQETNKSLDLYIVENARVNDLFSDNPLVTSEPNIVFYAGMPICTLDNVPLGTVCVIDRKPRVLTGEQETCLKILSYQVSKLLELRLRRLELNAALQELRPI